jgi:DNA-binding IclR family transcriptional regulator
MSETPGTVARALLVLTVIAEAKARVGVKHVSDTLKLPMSTSHRLLDLLLEAGFVAKDEARRQYGIGPEFFRISSLVTQKQSHSPLIQAALDRITKATGETAIYSTYLAAQRAMMYSAKSDSPNPLRFRVTLFERMPLEWGASGFAILAHLPPEVQEEVFTNAAPSPVSRKRLSRTAFFDRIERVRQEGYGVSESEKLPDSIGIGAPVMMAQGNVTGSITLTIPKVRFNQAKISEYAELVRREAANCSSDGQ